MARTLLDYCISPQAKSQPKPEITAEATSSLIGPTIEIKRKRKPHTFPPIAPANLPASYFVSAIYDGRQKKVVIKLYEPESGEIYFWYDNTGHKPYCLTNLSQFELEKIDRLIQHEGFDHFETIQKIDPLLDLQ